MGREDVNHSKKFRLVSTNRERGIANFEYYNTCLRGKFELSTREIALEIHDLNTKKDSNIPSILHSNLAVLREARGKLQPRGIGD